MTGSPPDFDDLDIAGLKALVLRLLEENAALRAEVAALREENRRLRGLQGPPDIKPSGMEKKAKARAKAKAGRKQARRGNKRSKVRIDEKRVLKIEAPEGSRFKGYENYLVQDMVCRPHTVLLRRERWVSADGRTLVAPLPAGLCGHFGAELRRFVLALYHQGQTTVGRLASLLRDLGVLISKRQVQRLLTEGQDGFIQEAREVLRAGIETAAWIGVDDTGARHAGRNGVTTRIGDDRFTWFGTTFSKSRRNFLELLQAGHEDYQVNAAALDYMDGRGLSKTVIARLAGSPRRHFADIDAWNAHLDALGIAALKVRPDPVKIATEGALWGGIAGQGLLDGTVVLSDDAGQFNVGHHALCWVHAERLVHKLDAFSDWQREKKERIRARIWWLYADLKAYRDHPEPRRRAALRRRFEALFTTRTGFASLDRLLARLHANRDELLVVLDRPEVPLHTNGAENDIRVCVTRRKISGGTRSETGRACRDAYLGLMKTCAKQGIRFWDYLGDRLGAKGAPAIPPLQDSLRNHNPA